MTSAGGQSGPSTVRTSQFWADSVIKPIDLKSVMTELELLFGQVNTPFFDLSPRGLFVNWFKRNAGNQPMDSGLSNRVSSAMTYSFDFVRVLQNYRTYRQPHRDCKAKPRGFLPPYPFLQRDCTNVPKELLVRTKEIPGNEIGSVYRRNTCLETVFETLDVNNNTPSDQCVGIELASSATSLWDELWGPDYKRHIVESCQDIETLVRRFSGESADGVTVIVVGPLKTRQLKNGFEEAFSMDAPLDFIEKLQKLVIEKENCPVRGILCVTADASNPSFEFVIGFFASIRFQLSHLKFVSTLRLPEDDGTTFSELLSGRLVRKALSAAASGETLLQCSDKGELQGCRVVPMAKPLTWTTSWVKPDCLYVISGATSGIAKTLLPALVNLGVLHFLLLVNCRHPSHALIKKLFRRGATTISVETCNLAEVSSVRRIVQKTLEESVATRVAGVFHLAGIADDNSEIPVKTGALRKVLQVKYEGHQTLLKAIDLHDGDVFSVPGSISTIIGSNGLGYAATNYACRALQLHSSRRLLAPFPVLGVSDLSMDNTRLLTTTELRKNVAKAGVLPFSSQIFDLGQTHPSTTPVANNNVIFLRANLDALDDYMNAIAPNPLFSRLVKLGEDVRTTPIQELLLTTKFLMRQPKTSGTEGNEPSFDSAEDALIAIIAEVTGLKDEVRENADESAFLDEAFSIDSITSLRLGKRLLKMGYNVSKESVVSETYGALLDQMKASQPEEGASETDYQNAKLTLGTEMKDEEIPVSRETLARVSVGHDTAEGPSLPSLWYAMVGAMILQDNIKVILHRMSSMNTDKITVMKNTTNNRTALTFLTSEPSKEALIRAQATASKKKLEPVPLVDESAKPFCTIEGSENILSMFRSSGFHYKGKYKSLRKVEVFHLSDNAEAKDPTSFVSNLRVQAEAYIDLSDDPILAETEAYFLAVDASFQAMFVGFFATFAPAMFWQTLHVPIPDLPRMLRANACKLTISVQFLSAKESQADGVTTAYVGRQPIATGQCLVKGFPIAIGARCYPQRFFCTRPRHTLLCFHGVAGTARDYDTLSAMMAPHGVRVLTVEFPHQGRRLKQTDDDVFDSLHVLQKDIMPWLRQMCRDIDGKTIPFSVVAMSGGGVCAYGLIRDYLVPEGLVPASFIAVVGTPPGIPNPHIERTWNITADNAVETMNYFSILAGFDGTPFREMPRELTQKRLQCILGPVHEMTAAAEPESSLPSKDVKNLLDIPAYIFGLKNDPVVDWNIMARGWKSAFTKAAWKQGGGRVHPLNSDFNHFFTFCGQDEQVFQQVFFQYGTLEDILRRPRRRSRETCARPRAFRRMARELARTRRQRRVGHCDVKQSLAVPSSKTSDSMEVSKTAN